MQGKTFHSHCNLLGMTIYNVLKESNVVLNVRNFGGYRPNRPSKSVGACVFKPNRFHAIMNPESRFTGEYDDEAVEFQVVQRRVHRTRH